MTSLTFHDVQSSNIAALAHHGGNLHVRFKDGATWSYANVPAQTFEAMKTAESVGKFFHAHVKGKFQGARV